MSEKILARASGRAEVRPGDLVLGAVDFAMGHDLTIPPAGKIMREQMGAEEVWDPERVAVVQDHFQPAKDAALASPSASPSCRAPYAIRLTPALFAAALRRSSTVASFAPSRAARCR